MPKKTKLNLNEIEVKSFKVVEEQKIKGGLWTFRRCSAFPVVCEKEN